jgi:molybdopterin-containing oxidoreductase family membrane subunit
MKSFKILWIVAIIGFIIGCISFADRLFYGISSHNTGSYISWGLLVSGYIYFIGLSAGAFLLSSLVYVFGVRKLEKIGKFSLFVALVCLVMAMLSIFFDLGHPFRSLIRFFVSPNFGSMMGWMIFLYSAYFVLLLAEFIVASNDTFHIGKLTSSRILTFLGAIGIPLAICFHGGVGAIFAVSNARPYWHSGLFPIMFIVEALLSGGALITLLTYFFSPNRGSLEHRELIRFLGRIVLGLLLFYVLLFISEILVVFYGEIPQHIGSYKFMMFGPYSWFFWVGQVLLAVLLPLSIFIFRGKSSKAVTLASILIVLGFVMIRLNIVVPGGAVPAFEGLRTAFIDSRLKFEYFPSLMEWLFELWILSLGLMIFLGGRRFLPLFKEEIR